MSSEKLSAAITAIKTGDKPTGARLLAKILQDEPSNATAWMWLAAAVDDVQKKKYCLKKALSLVPHDQGVRKALEHIENPPHPGLEAAAPNDPVRKPPKKPAPIQVASEIPASQKTPVTASVNKNLKSQTDPLPIIEPNWILILILTLLGLSLLILFFRVIKKLIGSRPKG